MFCKDRMLSEICCGQSVSSFLQASSQQAHSVNADTKSLCGTSEHQGTCSVGQLAACSCSAHVVILQGRGWRRKNGSRQRVNPLLQKQ